MIFKSLKRTIELTYPDPTQIMVPVVPYPSSLLSDTSTSSSDNLSRTLNFNAEVNEDHLHPGFMAQPGSATPTLEDTTNNGPPEMTSPTPMSSGASSHVAVSEINTKEKEQEQKLPVRWENGVMLGNVDGEWSTFISLERTR